MSEVITEHQTRQQVGARALELASENAGRSQGEADKSYKLAWKKYTTWVDAMRRKGEITVGDRYLTQANIDLYFTTVVVILKVNPNGARRIVSALQWYSNRQIYSIGEEKFKLECPLIVDALQDHQRVWLEAQNNAVVDPHANLPTNMLSDDEVCYALKTSLSTKIWMDMLPCWTTCEQALTRTDSFRKFKICDLVVDGTHGPKETGPDSQMLSVILRKLIHKERAHRIRVVGTWRHKNFLRCSTGMIALSLFVRLYDDVDLHFYKSTEVNDVPPWQKRRLIDGFETDKKVNDAYSSLLQQCGLRWFKVTHLRTLGCERASRRGCSDNVIGTMSKHVTKKIARYETELHPKILLVQAGLLKRDTYFVPRTHLRLPDGFSGDELVQTLFPKIRVWREQQADPVLGDHPHPKCAAHVFLWEVLPFLATVLFQDGIYWLRDFPHHEATVLLATLLPSWYPEWARHALSQVEEEGRNRQTAQVAVMNAATQASFDLLRQEQRIAHEAFLKEIRGVADQLFHAQAHQFSVEAPSIVPQYHVPAPNVVPLLLPTPQLQLEPPQLPPTVHLPPPMDAVRTVPPMPGRLPKTMVEFLRQHQTFGLADLADADKHHWPDNIRMAYSWRSYLYEKMLKLARRLHTQGDLFTVKLPEAARRFDQRRQGLTVPQYIESLKKLDTTVRKRKTRQVSQLDLE